TAEVQDDDLERKWLTPAHQESVVEVTAFRHAFRLLSPAHREVLVLVGVHGLSYEQVAAICRCEVGTVKSRVNRARNLLKRMLLEDELPVREEALPVRGVTLRPLAAEAAAAIGSSPRRPVPPRPAGRDVRSGALRHG